MTHRERTRRGFTLVETIAVLVVLAVFVPPALLAVRDSAVRSVSATLVSRARWLATEKLEDIIADRHSTTRGYAYVDESSYPDEPAVADSPQFSRSVSVVETGADLLSAGAGYKRIAVTVSWNDPIRGLQSIVIETAVTDQP
ncbi:MAG: prepilin-type N-terminal cleavage/methylation domain-containing protein [Planctomycetota bacterium]|nr:prepilin-type N-terminal cleavage/methylation domain-containing protein [Planctomycetota bacterium]